MKNRLGEKPPRQVTDPMQYQTNKRKNKIKRIKPIIVLTFVNLKFIKKKNNPPFLNLFISISLFCHNQDSN